MTRLTINLSDADRTWHRICFGPDLDSFLAACSIDPQTSDEWVLGNERFCSPPCWFDLQSWDEGLRLSDGLKGWVLIDLTARTVFLDEAAESEVRQSVVRMTDSGTPVALPYTLPNHWKISRDLVHWRTIVGQRRAHWSNQPLLQGRRVLYERSVEYIVDQLAEWLPRGAYKDGFWRAPKDWSWQVLGNRADPKSAPLIATEDLIAEFHARWLSTPRTDLANQSPGDLLNAHRQWIDRDLWDREHQWSMLGECPAPLPTHVSAYRWAGLGTHECVLYFDLLRDLLRYTAAEILLRPVEPRSVWIERVNDRRDTWLASPPDGSKGQATTQQIIDWERRRIPYVISPEEAIVDCECPLCQMMAEGDAPIFSHLNECWLDDEPVFQLSVDEFGPAFDLVNSDEGEEPEADLPTWPLATLMLELYSRIWFLYELLTDSRLTDPDVVERRLNDLGDAISRVQRAQDNPSELPAELLAFDEHLASLVALEEPQSYARDSLREIIEEICARAGDDGVLKDLAADRDR